jgi:thioredoxin reductase
VILATGGKVPRPAIPGADSPRVCTFEDVLRCKVEGCEYHSGDREPPLECGPAVLVWGDHFAAADTAEKLAGDGKKVCVVTEKREFAQWMEPCHRDVMFKRFAGGNGEGLTGKPFRRTVTVIANAGLTIDEGLALNANRALTSRHPTEVKLGVQE